MRRLRKRNTWLTQANKTRPVVKDGADSWNEICPFVANYRPIDYGEKPPETEQKLSDTSLIRDQLYTAFRTRNRAEIERIRAIMKAETDANKRAIYLSIWRNELHRGNRNES